MKRWWSIILSDQRIPSFGSLFFRCNICGSACCTAAENLQRETPSCEQCGSTVRARSIIHALSLALYGKSVALPDFSSDRGARGIGLSDWEGYAKRLAEKFTYVNTYYHQEPRLDISAEEQPLIGQLDFLISSDVFEHVTPPVSRAFRNANRLLKRNGALVLTVPYGLQSDTIEHFPDLYRYEIVERDGRRVLYNITEAGQEQTFNQLVFHGGGGETLEMRVFSETAIMRHLEESGFHDIKVHREPCFEFGIYQPEPWSLPISARV